MIQFFKMGQQSTAPYAIVQKDTKTHMFSLTLAVYGDKIKMIKKKIQGRFKHFCEQMKREEINMSLNFSEFAQLLYPYCGQHDTKSRFVITLTNNMVKRPGVCNKNGDYFNPFMNKKSNYLGKFFRGERKILPRKDVGVLIGNMEKYRFDRFIEGFSDDAKRNIAEALKKHGVTSFKQNRVSEKCADIFEAILIYGKYEE